MIEVKILIDANDDDFDSWAFELDLNEFLRFRFKGFWDFHTEVSHSDTEYINKYKKNKSLNLKSD